jgi:uridine kinase
LSKVDGKSFNPEQSRAISAAIDPNQPIVCIHGPSGSGKYRTAVEIAAMVINKFETTHTLKKDLIYSLLQKIREDYS